MELQGLLRRRNEEKEKEDQRNGIYVEVTYDNHSPRTLRVHVGYDTTTIKDNIINH